MIISINRSLVYSTTITIFCCKCLHSSFWYKDHTQVFQRASLCLTTITPEQLAFALRWFMLLLRYLGVSSYTIQIRIAFSVVHVFSIEIPAAFARLRG
ncbi:hypothetical protein RJT34_25672 [Clitoria ternatea]|uniref:Uncharacterized protein n=1 Tax=Clitoria ternatea TaxID=43366 RepID=A0AAN9FQE1_CLITE